MRKMYADVGYREKTHVTIVKPSSPGHDEVIFREFGPFDGFDQTIDELIKLMLKYEVYWSEFYCPQMPAIKATIKARLFGLT